MEVLKLPNTTSGYCGGMALCATCQVEVKHGLEKLPPPTDTEMDMLDQLPNVHR